MAIVILSGCDSAREDYNYECTVDRVEGTFLTTYFRTKTKSKMITMYRFTNEKKRTFIFPAERVQCAEML
jgi:hypothetical protein